MAIENTENALLYLEFFESNLLAIVVLFSLLCVITLGTYMRLKSENSESSIDSLEGNEKKVVDFVKSNGGEVKQKRISDEFEWSDAKTSRISTSLVEKGVVEKNRKDRQNVLEIVEKHN